MLSRKNYVFLGFQAAVAIGLLSGCVITSSPTGSGGSGGSSETTTVATTTTGSATTTTAGVGGSTTTTTTSGTGGSACVGETGTAVIADCDKINIAPGAGAGSICGPKFDQPAPGYGLCKTSFDLFNPGAESTLVDCLAKIGVQDACKTDPLQACMDAMFADECVIPSIATSCGEIKTACANDPFDVAKCTADLNPFSDTGLTALSTCINMADPTLNCQQAYDGCYTELLTF
jgi:hypothetical protein